jgi:hypothetical protein
VEGHGARRAAARRGRSVTTISSRCLPHHHRREPAPAAPSRSRSNRGAGWRPTPCG